MLFFTFLFFLFDAVTSVTLNFREGKIEGTTKYSSIGDKLGFQIRGCASQKKFTILGRYQGRLYQGEKFSQRTFNFKAAF